MQDDVQELVLRARRRDAQAFAALIEQFERAALAVAYGILHDADRAGDAVQEAFLRAWQELPALKDAAKFGGWLMQIVRHAAIDLRRRIRPTVCEFPDLAAPDDPEALATDGETRERVKKALATLDETTRTAVMLRYYEGKSAKEIADLLELSPAAVDMRLSRGRGQLKERLADLVEPESAAAGGPGRRVIGERS